MKFWNTLNHATSSLCSLSINVKEEERPLINQLGVDQSYTFVFYGFTKADVESLIANLQEIHNQMG